MKRPELCSLVLAAATSEVALISHLRSRLLRPARNRNEEAIAMPVREEFRSMPPPPIGHVEVAMPSNIVYEAVHCGYCWLADQSNGCLIQVHTLTEAGIIQSIKRRGGHYR